MFWFNRTLTQALPLIALQYHEVKITVNFRRKEELVVIDPEWADLDISPCIRTEDGEHDWNPCSNKAARAGWAIDECSLELNRRDGFESFFLVEYIYLDTVERRLFAAQPHEYLIDQVQFTGVETVKAKSTTYSNTLHFNHPSKELIWVLRDCTRVQNPVYIPQGFCCDGVEYEPDSCGIKCTGKPFVGGNNFFDFSGFHSPHDDAFFFALIQLNGHDRFQARHSTYFRLVQTWQFHTRYVH